MSIEPERPVEKLLRSYAKQRREQAGEPPSLHPAMRRELLSEAAKRYGQRRSTLSRWLVLKNFWPRLAIGAAAMAVLIVTAAVWTSVDRSKDKAPETQLAKNEGLRSGGTSLRLELAADRLSDKDSEKGDVSAPQPAPVAVSTAETSAKLTTTSLVAEAKTESEAQPQEMQEQVASAAPLSTNTFTGITEKRAAASPVPAKESRSLLAGTAVKSGKSMTDSLTAAEAPGATVASLGDARFRSTEQPRTQQQAMVFQNSAVNQLFSNNASYNNNRQMPTGAVMTQFRVEQDGQVLKIIDSDGSVYTGSLELVANEEEPAALSFTTRRTFQQANVPEPAQNASQLAQNFRVAVSGTNITLNQRVVFNGNLVGNNAAITGNFQNQATSLQNMKQQQGLNLIRLSGKARVGSGADLPVEAVPLH